MALRIPTYNLDYNYRNMAEKEFEPNNLPHPLTRFIGRETEITAVRKALSETRLLTLTGIGGSGKTRLAIQSASQLGENFPDGIWLVELSELSDPSLLPQTMAGILGLHKEPGVPLLETLISFFKQKHSLVVLDNCEHLIEACAHVSQALLVSCPQLKILATSREPLQVPGEVSWQVLPLSLPESDHRLTPQEALQFEAVQLFVERARSALPAFIITTQNTTEIVQLCRRLDGIPLALERAAAWINVLTVSQINERLDQSLQFLVRGSRTVPLRQQTLKAAFDWSHNLLTEKEKVLFRRLALFVSDFSLSAAEGICSEAGLSVNEILSLLSQLAGKSLLLIEEKDSQRKRFRMLEVIRQYSLEKLRAKEEEAYVTDRFLDYYLALVEKANSEIFGPQQGKWIPFLEQDISHLRTALRLSQKHPEQMEKGLRLASNLAQFWQLRGYLSEGAKWLEELLACTSDEPTLVRAQALEHASFLAFMLEDYDRATALTQEGREIYQMLSNADGVAYMINQLAFIALALGNYDQSNAFSDECLALLKENEINNPMVIASVLLCKGDVAFFQKDMESAVSFVKHSLELCQKMQNQWAIARRLARLGQFSYLQGHFKQALEYFKEGLTSARNSGDKWGMIWNLAGIGELAAELGKIERAARLLTGAQAILEVFSTRLRPVDRVLFENCETAVQAALGERIYQEIRSEMHERTLEQIVEYGFTSLGQMESDSLQETRVRAFRSMTPLQETKQKYGGLTAREREVATLVAQGKSNSVIAEELFVGVRTIEAHITSILTKLNFSSRTLLAGWAIKKGLASPPE